MDDLDSDADAPISNATDISVSELSQALKRTLEDRFGYVRVRGEISGYRGPHTSGHAYFSLKDANARLDAVVWRGQLLRMRIKPQEGLEVVAIGKITTFPGKSAYQIIVDQIEPAGVGALMALLEARRKALEAEGLFARERKKPLPYLPRVIGVVTSPTGAVIRDILHRLAERYPAHVLVWPVRVQGETAAAEVAAAIRGFNALEPGGKIPRPDVLIVARGGGSLEDLWSFNEEIVVRAAAASAIPLISAVGHETDWTLIDQAADLRAPTPTAAAELAAPVRAELVARLASLDSRGKGAILRFAERRRAELRALARGLPSGEALISSARQRIDLAAGAMRASSRGGFDALRLKLERVSRRLQAQSPSARAAAAAERLRSLRERLARAAGESWRRLGERLARAADAQSREAQRQAARRGEAFATLARRFDAAAAGRVRAQADLRPRVDAAAERLGRAFARGLERRRDALAGRVKLMEAVGYRNVLARGFALVRDGAGQPVRRAAEAPKSGDLQIEFADGTIRAQAGGAPRRRPAKRVDGDGQGSLI
jgi:exodeoxyribonuclease VII large subunit